MDYRSVLYDPVYQIEGVGAKLTLASGQVFDGLTAIDKTAGVQLPGPLAEVETLRPVASMLVGDLLDTGIDPDALDDATLELNDRVWKVNSTRYMPSPAGQADGEIYLLLEGTAG